MSGPRVTILDYGMGNLASVQNALQHVGLSCEVQSSVTGSDLVILPGVGAFGEAMKNLEPIRHALDAHVSSGKPILGICLGQQLLFESSEEHGQHQGLGYLPGAVRRLPRQLNLKLPHMGWSRILVQNEQASFLVDGEGPWVYFVHSYYTDADSALVAASANYGEFVFPAAVASEAIWAMQFHPEKSGAAGLTLLKQVICEALSRN